MDDLPSDNHGPDFGLVRTVYLLIGLLGSSVTGTLADTTGWVAAFILIIALLVLAGGFMIVDRTVGSSR